MTYVYLLQSIPFPNESYVGMTTDLKSRLRAHNAGASIHTSKYKPWALIAYVAFADEHRADSLPIRAGLSSGSERAPFRRRAQSDSRRNKLSGIARITIMMGRQKPGR